MSKDINIHVKTTGTDQTKQQLDNVGKSADKIGSTVEQAGSKSAKGISWIMSGLKSLAGPLGFAAIIGIVVKATQAIIEFYDTVKRKTDEAVQKTRELRSEFTELFEVMGAYSESEQTKIVKETLDLLGRTKTPFERGKNVVTEYYRQFGADIKAGRISPEQVSRGLTQFLEYENLHQKSGPELIKAARGWNIREPALQAELGRRISAGAGFANIEEPDFLGSFMHATPTARALNWDYNRLIENIAVITAGTQEAKQRKTLPLTTIEALANPNLPEAKELKKLGISPETAADPEKLYQQLWQKKKSMSPQDYRKMLIKFYGEDAATGIDIMERADREAVRRSQQEAVSPKAIAEVEKNIAEQKQTLLARDTARDIRRKKFRESLPPEKQYEYDVRGFGADIQEEWELIRPEMEALRKKMIPGTEDEKTHAAYTAWLESLPPEQRKTIEEKYKTEPPELISFGMEPVLIPSQTNPYREEWKKMTWKQRSEALGISGDGGTPGPGSGTGNTTIKIEQNHNIIINPKKYYEEDTRTLGKAGG